MHSGDRKVICRKMGQDICFREQLLQSLRELTQQAISRLVAKRLVYTAESLEVENNYRKDLTTVITRRDSLADTIEKKRSIRKVRYRIKERQIIDAFHLFQMVHGERNVAGHFV